jgi:flagellar motor switch protein FliM
MSSDALTMVMDAEAVAVMVAALFGGDLDQPVAPIERDLSEIETDVATIVFEQLAQILNGSGRRSLDLKLPVQRATTGVEAKRRTLRDGASVRITFGLSIPSASGTITVMIPQRVLLVQRGASAVDQAEMADWKARFSDEVMRSAVRLEATMPVGKMTLGQLAALEKGQILEMEETAQTDARLSARNKTLFVCEFGKLGQNYTVRIRHHFDAGQDLIDGLMHG